MFESPYRNGDPHIKTGIQTSPYQYVTVRIGEVPDLVPQHRPSSNSWYGQSATALPTPRWRHSNRRMRDRQRGGALPSAPHPVQLLIIDPTFTTIAPFAYGISLHNPPVTTAAVTVINVGLQPPDTVCQQEHQGAIVEVFPAPVAGACAAGGVFQQAQLIIVLVVQHDKIVRVVIFGASASGA